MKQQIFFQSFLLKGRDAGARLRFSLQVTEPVLLRRILPTGFAICLYLN